MSDAQIATLIASIPFLTLCALWLAREYFEIRAEIVRLRELRVISRRERA